MNEVIKNIISRRTVRKFKPEQIKDSDLEMIIEAAKSAPSAMNSQSWHFTVVQNKARLTELNSAVIETILQGADENLRRGGTGQKLNYFYNAPAIIIISDDKKTDSPAPEADCAAAMQNILLASSSLGIGSCWLHILATVDDVAHIRELLTSLGVPKDFKVYGTALLGYPDGEVKDEVKKREGTVNIVK